MEAVAGDYFLTGFELPKSGMDDSIDISVGKLFIMLTLKGYNDLFERANCDGKPDFRVFVHP